MSRILAHMGAILRAGVASVAFLMILVASYPDPAIAGTLDNHHSLGIRFAVQESVDQVVGDAAIGLRRAVRQLGRNTVFTIKRAFKAWGRYLRRGAKFALVALLIGLADGNLIAAWRSSGLKVITNYVPLMTYVYTRLLFDRRVYIVGKALLFGALVYGVVRRDLIPDRALFPGLVDDLLLLGVAVRLFVNWCNDEVVFAHATDAVNRWGRLVALQRARNR